MALTIINTTTNLTELVCLQNKTSAHVALQFENTWLSRYPLPMHCIYDQGGEFSGFEFQRMLQRRNIKKHPTGVHSPQANAICERMHQVVGNALCVLATLHPPDGIEDANTLIDTALANAVYATRSTYHSGLNGTPGSIVFNRDMVLDIPFIADLQMIQNHRQQLIDNRLIDANNKRFSHDYNVGEQVLTLIPNSNKLDPRAEGPYVIERVHANGTLTIRINAHLTERVSLRRVKPYHTSHVRFSLPARFPDCSSPWRGRVQYIWSLPEIPKYLNLAEYRPLKSTRQIQRDVTGGRTRNVNPLDNPRQRAGAYYWRVAFLKSHLIAGASFCDGADTAHPNETSCMTNPAPSHIGR